MGNLENAEKRADGIGWKTVEVRSKKTAVIIFAPLS
jgi:hypothetical protein